MSLLSIKAEIQCQACGDIYYVVLEDHAHEAPFTQMLGAIREFPRDNGAFIQDEFLCPSCNDAWVAAGRGESFYRKWRKQYQKFLDDAEAL